MINVEAHAACLYINYEMASTKKINDGNTAHEDRDDKLRVRRIVGFRLSYSMYCTYFTFTLFFWSIPSLF